MDAKDKSSEGMQQPQASGTVHGQALASAQSQPPPQAGAVNSNFFAEQSATRHSTLQGATSTPSLAASHPVNVISSRGPKDVHTQSSNPMSNPNRQAVALAPSAHPLHPAQQRKPSGLAWHQNSIERHFRHQPGKLGRVDGGKGRIGNAHPQQRRFFPCGKHNPLTMRCKLATNYRGTFNEQTHREHIVRVHAADAGFRLDISHGPGYVKQLRISAETSDQ